MLAYHITNPTNSTLADETLCFPLINILWLIATVYNNATEHSVPQSRRTHIQHYVYCTHTEEHSARRRIKCEYVIRP